MNDTGMCPDAFSKERSIGVHDTIQAQPPHPQCSVRLDQSPEGFAAYAFTIPSLSDPGIRININTHTTKPFAFTLSTPKRDPRLDRAAVNHQFVVDRYPTISSSKTEKRENNLRAIGKQQWDDRKKNWSGKERQVTKEK